jgi:hypothetical protein
MYTKSLQSQHLYPKLPLDLAISRIPVSDYLKDPAKFIDAYRGHGSRIANLFMDYRNRSTFTLTNHYIARIVGCDPRVVRRWTARFVEDGWLIKRSKDYNANVYKIVIDSKSSYAMFMKSNPDKAMFLCNQVISVNERSVLPNRDIIYINPSPILSYTAGARETIKLSAREVYTTQKKEAERSWFNHQLHVRVVRGIKMLQEEQQKYIALHKKQPAMKDILSKGPVREALISPSIVKLAGLLELTELEQIKLIAFPDDLIEEVYIEAEKVKNGSSPRARDRIGWLMAKLGEMAKNANLKPNWKWVFDVCEILGLDPRAKSEARPFGRKMSSVGQGRYYPSQNQPKVNATTPEYVKTHEWKGHVEVPRKVHDNDKLRGYLLDALHSPLGTTKFALHLYPLEVQELSYDLLSTENSCYCIELSRKGRWVLENNTCKHKRRDNGEDLCP